MQLACKVYCARDQVPFYMWRIKLPRRNRKLPKYYGQDCLEKFHLHLWSLIIIQVPKTTPILTQNTKIYQKSLIIHCVKSVLIRSFSGPYFPAFGLNTERYSVQIRENTDKKNCEYGHFPPSDLLLKDF